MKRSFIITAAICLVLGESFSVINKKESAKVQAPAYCCLKVCKPVPVTKKVAAETQAGIPMVNIWGYN